MTGRFGAVMGVLVMGLALSACGGGSSASPIVAEPNSPTIAATGLAFDRTELDVPSGRPFTLVLDNQDSVPHNVAIYRDSAATDRLFVGDVVNGPASRVYAVPALPVGTWYFRCDVHPDMHGDVIATSG